jgi:hypothetical protein
VPQETNVIRAFAAGPATAVRHPSCLVLGTPHRFGPDVMRLANLLP